MRLVDAFVTVAIVVVAAVLAIKYLPSEARPTTVVDRNPDPTPRRPAPTVSFAASGGYPVPAGALKRGELYPPIYPGSIGPGGWMRIGLLVRKGGKGKGGSNLLTLFQRPIGPYPSSTPVLEYKAEDKDGFTMRVEPPYGNEFEDGDVVEHVTGKGGPWKVVLELPKYVSVPPFSVAPVPTIP